MTISTADAGENSRIIGLDLLRGLAAFAVAIPHFQMFFVPGGFPVAEAVSIAAVEIFFVLSGFVLGSQIELCVRRGDAHTLRTFLFRRWMRTVPAYLLALLAISILHHQIGTADFFRYMVYAQNLLWQHNVKDYFAVAWSLSVEEWYYVVFPLFLLSFAAVARARPSRNMLLAATIAFVAGIALIRIVFGDNADWGEGVRRVVIFRIDSIAYGFMLYLVLTRKGSAGATPTSQLGMLLALVAATVALVGLNLRMISDHAVWLRQISPFVSAAFGMAAVTFFVSIDRWLAWPFVDSVSRYLGQISYSVYLFHLIVLTLIGRLTTALGFGEGVGLFVLYLTCTVALATLVYRAVERPILAARPSFNRSPLAGIEKAA